MNDRSEIMLVCMMIALAFVSGAIIAAIAVNDTWKHDAIKHGAGLYCPATGAFAWNGGCHE